MLFEEGQKTLKKKIFFYISGIVLGGCLVVAALAAILIFPEYLSMRDFKAQLTALTTEIEAIDTLGPPKTVLEKGQQNTYLVAFDCGEEIASERTLVFFPFADIILYVSVQDDGRIVNKVYCGT